MRLFCFGLGYTARALARLVAIEGGVVVGTSRDGDQDTLPFSRNHPLNDPGRVLAESSHLLVSIAPGRHGDPVLAQHAQDIAAVKGLRWIGYLSTTGVYGDTGGRMADESSPLAPTSERGQWRVEAEAEWLALVRTHGLPVHVFRLSGIYGPGRSVLDKVREGTARRVDKPDHLFSRIHVEDIARVLRASMERPRPGAIYNVCDDRPAPPADVVAHACSLLGLEPPPLLSFADAAREMSPMALEFWRDNRLVDNSLVKQELGIAWRYPDYESGLRAIVDEEESEAAKRA